MYFHFDKIQKFIKNELNFEVESFSSNEDSQIIIKLKEVNVLSAVDEYLRLYQLIDKLDFGNC
jgi:hypothetical protein